MVKCCALFKLWTKSLNSIKTRVGFKGLMDNKIAILKPKL